LFGFYEIKYGAIVQAIFEYANAVELANLSSKFPFYVAALYRYR